jgi:hypothetical protein
MIFNIHCIFLLDQGVPPSVGVFFQIFFEQRTSKIAEEKCIALKSFGYSEQESSLIQSILVAKTEVSNLEALVIQETYLKGATHLKSLASTYLVICFYV